MSTVLFTHPDCTRHEMTAGHPERPARIAAILEQLEKDGLMGSLDVREATPASRAHLTRAHGADYVDHVFSVAPQEENAMVQLDGDTSMNSHSLRAALLAAGAGIEAVDRVLQGECRNAFCCVRPPGHHAERNQAMGFCFFGSVAVAALHALQQDAVNKVAIVDFDVHHGNGTEDLISGRDDIFFCSSFQHPLYPGYFGKNIDGQKINIPLPAATEGAVFQEQMRLQCLPALEAFKPDMIFISAGFDAHADDLLGGLNLLEEDFSWITEQLVQMADRHCDGRIVSMLEGGYDLASLGRSASAHVSELLKAATAAG